MTPDDLKRWREAHGLSQRQLALRLGVSQAIVACWEQPKEAKHSRTPAQWLRFALPQIEADIKKTPRPMKAGAPGRE